jgi:hypothetical protein
VSARQLAKIDKMNKTLTNTLQNALERINLITEDIGSSRISPKPVTLPAHFDSTTPRFRQGTDTLRLSSNSTNYQHFLSKLHSSQDWQRFSGVLINDTKFDAKSLLNKYGKKNKPKQ